MELHRIVAASQAVSATRKRTEKVGLLAACLGGAAPAAAGTVACYLAGEMPQGRIGIGYAQLAASAGVAAAASSALCVAEVEAAFAGIAAVAGKGANARRAELLHDLLAAATPDEQGFLRALLVGELRQGALESLVVDALSKAGGVPLAAVRRARMLAGELKPVAEAALGEGDRDAALAAFTLQLFKPVESMLASPADSVEEAIERLGGPANAAFEVKLDGARIQLHREGSEVRVYSRLLNDVTAAVPEVVELAGTLPGHSCILDGEAIALDRDDRPLPFQDTMRRFGRRANVDALRAELPLHASFFDCLMLDGELLIDADGATRDAALRRTVPTAHAVERRLLHDASAVTAFFAEVREAGHEGLMAKSLQAPYEAGRRGAGWLKLKTAHTLDLLVIAAEWGSGRRKGRLSNLHLAARDPEGGAPVMLGKTFKGLTDKLLAWQTEALLARETHRDDYAVHVRPELVVEIAFNDVQRSSQYPGGVALRFARVKGYREDKGPEEADDMNAVLALQ